MSDSPDVIDTRESVARQQFDTMGRYAVLSDAAYNYYDYGKDDATNTLVDYLPLHSLDEKLSDDKSIVITDKDGHVIIAYRGTDPSNPKDLLTDLTDVALKSPVSSFGYFEEALKKYDSVKTKYGNDANIVTTGHSLGGSLAYFVGKKRDAPSFVFNMGSSPFDFLPSVLSDTPSNMSTHYYVSGDPISTSQVIKDRFTSSSDRSVEVKPKDFITDVFGKLSFGLPVNLFAHSRAHFLPDKVLESIPEDAPLFSPFQQYIESVRKERREEVPLTEKQKCLLNPNDPRCRKRP